MKQLCLCNYLGVTCNHADTFLHIPLSIRQRIYLYAGLVTGTYISYPDFERVENDSDLRVPHEDFVVTWNLTNVCLQMREEIEAMLVNHNVCIYQDDTLEDGLEFLWQSSPYVCSMLRNVYIHLHVMPSHFYSYGLKKPLKWRLIEKWQKAAANILAHATPGQLSLHLICDTGDSKKTAAVLLPLYDFPGRLFELDLRLLDRKGGDPKLSILAREAALQAQAPNPRASGYFRFFDLPPEIRRNIFEYTNLVAPFRKVHWEPKWQFYAAGVFCECDGSVCLEEDLHNNSMGRCGAWSRITGDFCMHDHASHSSRCNHSHSPLPLLLTCRAMYEEAIEFFYSSNRIVIQPDFDVKGITFAGPSTLVEQPLDTEDPAAQTNMTDLDHYYASQSYLSRDSTKIFIEKVGPKALKLIRNLEIVFPQIGPSSDLSDTAPAYREWRMAVDHLVNLARKEDVRKLTLIVHIWTAPAGSFRSVPLEKTAPILDTKGPRLLHPLRALLQLERLFVHLEWPEHWSAPKLRHDIKTSKRRRKDSPGCGIGLHYIPTAKKNLFIKEIVWERTVMGAEYDSYKMGKGNELPSQWVRAEWDQRQ